MCTYSDALESAFSARQRRVTAVHRATACPLSRPMRAPSRKRGAAGWRLAREGRATRRADPDPGAHQGHRRDE